VFCELYHGAAGVGLVSLCVLGVIAGSVGFFSGVLG